MTVGHKTQVWPMRAFHPLWVSDWFRNEYVMKPCNQAQLVDHPTTLAWDTGKEPFSLPIEFETMRLLVWSFWQQMCFHVEKASLRKKQTWKAESRDGGNVSPDAIIQGDAFRYTCSQTFLDFFSFKSQYIWDFLLKPVWVNFLELREFFWLIQDDC